MILNLIIFGSKFIYSNYSYSHTLWKSLWAIYEQYIFFNDSMSKFEISQYEILYNIHLNISTLYICITIMLWFLVYLSMSMYVNTLIIMKYEYVLFYNKKTESEFIRIWDVEINLFSEPLNIN